LKTWFRLFIVVIFVSVVITIFQSCNVQVDVTVPTVVNVLHKGLYVDRFQDILGDPANENKLLRYVKSHDFNELILYDLREITNKISEFG